MPDQSVEHGDRQPYPSGLEARVSRLEDGMQDMRGSLGRLEATMARLEAMFIATLPHLATRQDIVILPHLATKEDIALLPHLATKEQVAALPTRTYLWGVLGVLITAIFGAFGAGLAAIAMLR